MTLKESSRNELIAQVKQWQSEALVRMMSPATKRDSRIYHDGEIAAYGNVLKLIGKEEE